MTCMSRGFALPRYLRGPHGCESPLCPLIDGNNCSVLWRPWPRWARVSKSSAEGGRGTFMSAGESRSEFIRRLRDDDRNYLWHPFTQMKDYEREEPLIIERGEGSYLIDME